MTQAIAVDGTASAPPVRPANPLLNAPILPTLVRLTLPNLAAMLVMPRHARIIKDWRIDDRRGPRFVRPATSIVAIDG